jgi:hypothetical protein
MEDVEYSPSGSSRCVQFSIWGYNKELAVNSSVNFNIWLLHSFALFSSVEVPIHFATFHASRGHVMLPLTMRLLG